MSVCFSTGLKAIHTVYCSWEVIIIETLRHSPTRRRFSYTWLTVLLIWLLSLSPSTPLLAPTLTFLHPFSLLPQVCRTKEKRNITQRRWSTYKIYKVLHQNQLPRFMRTLICCCSALLFKAPWQCDCPFFLWLLFRVCFVIQNLKSLSNGGEAVRKRQRLREK